MNAITHRLFRIILGCAACLLTSQVAAEPIFFPSTIKGISVIETEPAFVPSKLYHAGIATGWTKVAVSVDENGRLMDALVLGYSNPEFGESTLEALRKWKFTPASVHGRPITSVTQLHFTYSHASTTARVVLIDGMEYTRRRGGSDKGLNKLYRLDELDHIPVPIHIISPAYSDENARQHAGKKVIVDFYIDETGEVRLPTLYYADDSDVARQALAAVAQWQFEPPMHEGKAVITRARQEFVFSLTEEEQEEAPDSNGTS